MARQISKLVADILETKLNIPSDRFYLTVHSAKLMFVEFEYCKCDSMWVNVLDHSEYLDENDGWMVVVCSSMIWRGLTLAGRSPHSEDWRQRKSMKELPAESAAWP